MSNISFNLAQYFKFKFNLGSCDKNQLTENVTYSEHQDISYGYGSSCTKSLLTTTDHSLGGAYLEESCNTKNLCLYKDMSYDICKAVGSVVEEESEETGEIFAQVQNNNFDDLPYGAQQIENQQYASCSNVHNISMISSACYSNSTAIAYTNTVYQSHDCNKNYEEVRNNQNFGR